VVNQHRESARRSRLRKQAECEDLNKKVDYLAVDNTANLKELQRLKLLCDKLNTDNEALQVRVWGGHCGRMGHGLYLNV
jgi:plant G-box-binding factor